MRRFLVLACLSAVAGCAGDKAAPTTSAPPPRQIATFGLAPGAAPADPAPLTRDQLHQCVAESQQVHQGGPGVGASQAGLLQRQDALKARQADLEAQKPVPGASNSVIAAYNKKVKDLNADYTALKRDDTTNSAKVGGINGVAAKFNAECSGRSFYTDDFDAVKTDFPGFDL